MASFIKYCLVWFMLIFITGNLSFRGPPPQCTCKKHGYVACDLNGDSSPTCNLDQECKTKTVRHFGSDINMPDRDITCCFPKDDNDQSIFIINVNYISLIIAGVLVLSLFISFYINIKTFCDKRWRKQSRKAINNQIMTDIELQKLNV